MESSSVVSFFLANLSTSIALYGEWLGRDDRGIPRNLSNLIMNTAVA